MMRLCRIDKSKNPKKKFDAVFRDKECPCKSKEKVECGRDELVVSFGAKGMEDYTIHKDEARKELYLKRHKKNEDWNDPTTPGALSRWILWNLPDFKDSVADFKKRFKL
jgi:L-rhamnose mutarotase